MTDDLNLRRIDLRALEDGPGAPNPDEIIQAAIARNPRLRGAGTPDDYQQLRKYIGPALLAAGILGAIAIGTVRTTRFESSDAMPIRTIADWTESHHLPSNAELLNEFQGYGK